MNNVDKKLDVCDLIIYGCCICGIIISCFFVAEAYTSDKCIGTWQSLDDNTDYIVFLPNGTGYIKSDEIVDFTWTRLPIWTLNNLGLDYTFELCNFNESMCIQGIIYGNAMSTMYLDNKMVYQDIRYK